MLIATPGDVVDEHGLVGRRRHGLGARRSRAGEASRVVRRHDEDAVDAELVCALGQVDRVAGVVGAGAGDDGRPVADLLERRGVEVEALVVAQCRALPVVPVTTRPSEPFSTVARKRAEGIQVDRAVPSERVTIAVSTSPSTGRSYIRLRRKSLTKAAGAEESQCGPRRSCCSDGQPPLQHGGRPCANAPARAALPTSAIRHALQQRVEADGEIRRQRADPVERQQRTRDGRPRGAGVVADRQRLSRGRRRSPPGARRGPAAGRSGSASPAAARRRSPCRPRGRVELLVVVELDDLGRGSTFAASSAKRIISTAPSAKLGA